LERQAGRKWVPVWSWWTVVVKGGGVCSDKKFESNTGKGKKKRNVLGGEYAQGSDWPQTKPQSQGRPQDKLQQPETKKYQNGKRGKKAGEKVVDVVH